MKRAAKGQVFLADNEILRRIADATALTPDEAAVEIGMGRGQLTQHLVRRAREVVAVELEERFVDETAQAFTRWDNLTIVHGNVLDLEWDDFLPAGEKVVVAGNIPFYITGPILRVLSDRRDCVKRWVLMMQREVAERICASPGGKAYGALAVKMQTAGKPRFLFVVPAAAFEPSPAVDAAVVAYTYNEDVRGDAALFDQFVDFLFGARRRKLANRLMEMMGGAYGRPQLEKFLQKAGAAPDARPEDLTPAQFETLFAALAPAFGVQEK